MTQKKTAHTEGFDEYEDIKAALEKVKTGWDEVGRTDKYSTGFSILDDYLGGGYGSNTRGEVILIHATSKTYKSTLATQFIRQPLERGESLGIINLEGRIDVFLTELRKLYSPREINGKVEGYERFDSLAEKLPNQIFATSIKMLRNEFRMSEIVEWMKKTLLEHGTKLFLVDPIGYVSDFAEVSNIPDYKRESKLMKEISDFAYDTNSTVICIQHNVKDGDNLHPAHRQSAVGGSQSFTKSATKVIELRFEALVDKEKKKSGKYISLEMYMARGVSDWRLQPVILEIREHDDEKGIIITMPKYEQTKGDDILADPSKRESRWLWRGQIKGDLEELMEDV